MLSSLKPLTENITEQLALPFKHVSPNVLTLVGIVPSILFFIAVLQHAYGWALIFFLGNLFDMLDGAVAKRFHKITNFGGFLDSTADRIADFFIIAGFGFAQAVHWEIVVPLLCLSFLVSYVRSRAELASRGTKNFAVGFIERTERLIIIFIGLFLFWLFPEMLIGTGNILEIVFVGLIMLSLLTFLQRVYAAYTSL